MLRMPVLDTPKPTQSPWGGNPGLKISLSFPCAAKVEKQRQSCLVLSLSTAATPLTGIAACQSPSLDLISFGKYRELFFFFFVFVCLFFSKFSSAGAEE